MIKCHNLVVLLCLAVSIPTLNGNVLEDEGYWVNRSGEYDAYWKERQQVAKAENEAAYNADPYAVSGNLTSEVSE